MGHSRKDKVAHYEENQISVSPYGMSLGLTACGSKEKVDDELAEALSQSSIGIIENVYNGLDEATSQDLQSEGAEGVEYVFESYFGMKVDGNGMISAFDSYLMATKEIGNLVSINNYTAEYDTSGEKIIVTINCTFDNKTADVEFIYKKDLYHTFTSSATNINYTFGEKMAKAGLNTLMGMGTVFAVLILIYGIISLFNFIPKIEAVFSKKKDVQPTTTSVDNAISQIVESEELTDDLELVAVISAAIAAYEGSSSTDQYVVRSIRRVSNGSKWQKAL